MADEARPAPLSPVPQPNAPTFVCVWDDFDPDDADEDEPFEHEQPATAPVPSPGERLLHALGQLHRLHLCGRLPARPDEFDVEDLARIVGVWPELELVLADDDGTRYHFAGEVLFISAERPAMVRLLSTLEFAAELDLKSGGGWTAGTSASWLGGSRRLQDYAMLTRQTRQHCAYFVLQSLA